MTLSSVETFGKYLEKVGINKTTFYNFLERFIGIYISSIYVIEVLLFSPCIANLWKVILFFIVVQINWKLLFIRRVFKIPAKFFIFECSS